MNRDEVFLKIQVMVEVQGEREVVMGLIACGFAPSTADKMAKGDYRVARFNRKTVTKLGEFFERASRKSA